MTSPALTLPVRSYEQFRLDQAAELTRRNRKADHLPPDLFLNFYGTWERLEVITHKTATEAASGVNDYEQYRVTVQFLPDGSTRPLDLSDWASAFARPVRFGDAAE